jgi:hypothetical protein
VSSVGSTTFESMRPSSCSPCFSIRRLGWPDSLTQPPHMLGGLRRSLAR